MRQAATGPAGEVEWVVDQGGDPVELALDVRSACDAVRELSPPLREAVVAVEVVGLATATRRALCTSGRARS